MAELTEYVTRRVQCAPDSPGRILRSERKKGNLVYHVVDRSSSLYKVDPLVTLEHLNAAKLFFRGEGQRPLNRTRACSDLATLSKLATHPNGTAAIWDATISDLVSQGYLSAVGDRVAYVLDDQVEDTPKGTQEMLF